MILKKLQKAELIHPPKWLVDNTLYMTIMGSMAYGVSADNSDMDVYGFCMPPLDSIFSHLAGEIEGFGTQKQKFNVWQQHHIKSPDSKQEYDFSIYSIVKYFHLVMQNSPNMIDSLFTPQRCVIHNTQIGDMVRSARKDFLHKGAMASFRGYSFQQKHKMKTKQNSTNEKRQADIEQFGYSTKFAYHLIRLLLECEQILVEGDLDLERNNEVLKSVRRGEWSLKQIDDFFDLKEKHLEEAYSKSTLPHSPNENKIKELLLQCIEHHYGTVSQKLYIESTSIISDLKALIEKHGGK
jgi:uncharacterized protein